MRTTQQPRITVICKKELVWNKPQTFPEYVTYCNHTFHLNYLNRKPYFLNTHKGTPRNYEIFIQPYFWHFLFNSKCIDIMAVAFTEYLNICPPLELIKTSTTETELQGGYRCPLCTHPIHCKNLDCRKVLSQITGRCPHCHASRHTLRPLPAYIRYKPELWRWKYWLLVTGFLWPLCWNKLVWFSSFRRHHFYLFITILSFVSQH